MMFRLIQVHVLHGVPRIEVDPDGFATERAALARYREVRASHFGVGRFDTGGHLCEIVMDTTCGPGGGCARPAVVLNAETYERLCDTCAFGTAVLTVPELAMRLGVAVRLAPVLAGSGRHALPDPACAASNRIARELATCVGDPVWRMALCAELAERPGNVNGLLIGLGALSHRDVLDLWPDLRTLGAQLPGHVQDDLIQATGRPMSPAGVAALRLGL